MVFRQPQRTGDHIRRLAPSIVVVVEALLVPVVLIDLSNPNMSRDDRARLSDEVLPMPEAYFICWGLTTMTHKPARDFLNWVLSETKAKRDMRGKKS